MARRQDQDEVVDGRLTQSTLLDRRKTHYKMKMRWIDRSVTTASGHLRRAGMGWRRGRCTPESCRPGASPDFGSPGPERDL